MKQIKSDPVKTVLTITVGFMIIYMVLQARNETFDPKKEWLLIAASVIGLIGMFSPYLTRKIEWGWMKLTYILSLIIPNLLLGAIFFLFLFPISLLSKLFGNKDPLFLKNKASLYVDRGDEIEEDSFTKPW